MSDLNWKLVSFRDSQTYQIYHQNSRPAIWGLKTAGPVNFYGRNNIAPNEALTLPFLGEPFFCGVTDSLLNQQFPTRVLMVCVLHFVSKFDS